MQEFLLSVAEAEVMLWQAPGAKFKALTTLILFQVEIMVEGI
jgi:hypothetical protein